MTNPIERLNAALEGRYALDRELGAGGMATVFLANDERHDRQVAVKVLKPELAAVIGAERFVSEIKTTARLQHPHILPLFDSGEADGFLFYVMPFVEGESLRDRLDSERQLSVDESLRITLAVAGALQYAHEHDIIHRDIKPENILLHAGEPVVADFGIALAVSAAGGGRMTETGLSLGTPHYMSPEQATADRDLSARSDVYSLACVLYEMLAGDPPHTGPTSQSILMRILTEEPRPVTEVRRSVPRNVASALTKALEKLPADRFESAEDFRKALQEEAFRYTPVAVSAPHAGVRPSVAAGAGADPGTTQHLDPTRATAAIPGAAAATRAGPDRRFQIAASVAALATAAAAWGWLGRPAPPTPQVARFEVALPADQQLNLAAVGNVITISPDGSRIVYRGAGGRLWLRPLDRLESQAIPGTESSQAPGFSPDGRTLIFGSTAPNSIRSILPEGGPSLPLIDDGFQAYAGDWGADGWVYTTMSNGDLGRFPATGGDWEVVATVDPERAERHRFTDVLPNGKGVLTTRWLGSITASEVAVIDLETREVRSLLPGFYPRYVQEGFLFFVREGGTLFAAPFDPVAMELTGPAAPILEGIVVGPRAEAHYAISENGTLVYVSGSAQERELVWVDRSGVEQSFEPRTNGRIRTLALSPDGSQVALSLQGAQSEDIWLQDVGAGPRRRLTFEGTSNVRPEWTPDGDTVLFSSNRGAGFGLSSRRADGVGDAYRIPGITSFGQVAASPDGRWLLHRNRPDNTASGRNLSYLERGGDTTATSFVDLEADVYDPEFSPDGRWVAYVSVESGQREIFVRSFPSGDQIVQVSEGGGSAPHWSRSGTELFFQSPQAEVLVATVAGESTFRVLSVEALFSAGEYANGFHQWDVDAGDDRFLMIRVFGGDPKFIVVQNIFEEVRDRLGREGG